MHHGRVREGQGRATPAGAHEFHLEGTVAVGIGDAEIAAVAAQNLVEMPNLGPLPGCRRLGALTAW